MTLVIFCAVHSQWEVQVQNYQVLGVIMDKCLTDTLNMHAEGYSELFRFEPSHVFVNDI